MFIICTKNFDFQVIFELLKYHLNSFSNSHTRIPNLWDHGVSSSIVIEKYVVKLSILTYFDVLFQGINIENALVYFSCQGLCSLGLTKPPVFGISFSSGTNFVDSSRVASVLLLIISALDFLSSCKK